MQQTRYHFGGTFCVCETIVRLTNFVEPLYNISPVSLIMSSSLNLQKTSVRSLEGTGGTMTLTPSVVTFRGASGTNESSQEKKFVLSITKTRTLEKYIFCEVRFGYIIHFCRLGQHDFT